MEKIIEVKLRHGTMVKYFKIKDKEYGKGDKVIVRDQSFQYSAEVLASMDSTDIENDTLQNNIVEYVRDFKKEDDEIVQELKQKEYDGKKICEKYIKKNELDMKLVDCEISFDKKKVLFNFTADDRVDFRELVKDLASEFKMRVELRQIGVRDEAQILGGLGRCGRTYCCKQFLNDFESTTIKMAKTQNMSLNPSKISGVCGRLMCCLANEEETYKFYGQNMPAIGDMVSTKNNRTGIVSDINILKQKVKVIIDTPDDIKEMVEYRADEVKLVKKKGELQDE